MRSHRKESGILPGGIQQAAVLKAVRKIAEALNAFLDTVTQNVHYARRKLMDAGKEVTI